MIQLKVYDSPARLEQYFIDLYETEPIKLTLSIEDITNADATSTYSKAFKVPGTRSNWEFFKNSFDVDGTVYDVTIKKPAEILVDGAEFKLGHIRLQKVFLNTLLDRYDYEILFMGETRDFSAVIGEKYMCQLQLNDLIGGADPNTFTVDDAVKSWEAYPQAFVPQTGAPYTPGLTTGLHNGNIIYPLIDHGNTYTDAGLPEQTRIALDGTPNFTQNSHPLSIDRLKPMIRAKRLWDQIFEDAGYSYTSAFIESDLFHQKYISAFGNVATIGWDAGVSSTTSNNVAHAEILVGDWGPAFLPNGIVDPGNNFAQVTFGGITQYANRVVTTYTIPGPGTYEIAASAYYNGYNETSNYRPTVQNADINLYNITQGQIVFQSFAGNSTSLQFDEVFITGVTPFFSVGDVLCILVGDLDNAPDSFNVTSVLWDILSAPGIFNPASGLDCTYKQIDFIKDMLTAFRLVLSPDPRNPKNFIVEPWQTYINSGDLRDWSSKLVENKDVIVEPVFFSQVNTLDFKFQPGGDYTNVYHQQAYSEPYGYLQFNSNNELLTGKRDIKLVGIAPTEIVKIESDTSTIDFVIAQLHTHSSEDTGLQHKPIKPKSRFLFYNGLSPVGGLPQANHWYLSGSTGNTTAGNWDIYPLVSPYQVWPIQPQTLNLNWANDIQYWGQEPGYNALGSTLYSDYWTRYISSLYGKYSRRVTAYFVLNNIDLNSFSFDDTIFVNGTYYIPEKIIDVEIGAYTEVKVQLLTANDYRPTVVPDEILSGFSATGVEGDCAYGVGSIDVITNGTPEFSWNLGNGLTGVALQGFGVGNDPYSFTIPGVSPGTYTLEVIDSLTRSKSVTVIVPVSTATVVTATSNVTPTSDCVGATDGQIQVTPAGGTGPYEIYWTDFGGNNSFTRTGLAQGNYEFTILDSLGCGVYSYIVEVPCGGAVATVYEFQKLSNNCFGLEEFAYVALTTEPDQNDVYTLNEFNGCFRYSGVIFAFDADSTINQLFPDCETCYGIPASTDYQVESCTTPGVFHVTTFNVVPTIGTIYNISNFSGCYTVIQASTATPDSASLTGPYNSCDECAPCQQWRSGPYDDQISYSYIDCNNVQQNRFTPCNSTICRSTICAKRIISSSEPFTIIGPC
jgi:hypothetical protein